jgi:hypothetical protein
MRPPAPRIRDRHCGNTPRVPAPSAPALATLALLAAVCVGCGASDRGSDVDATAERFQTALEEGDGELACAQLDEDTASKLERQSEERCEQAILELELPSGGTPARTSVYVTSASVTLDEGGTLFLNEAASGWQIDAAGCRPQAPELPLDCELEN